MGTDMEESEVHDLIELAFAALADGDYVRALAVGDQLVADLPDRAVVRAIRAQALLGSDAPEESYDEARRAVDLAPEDERAHRLLAMAAWRTERLALAQESFERAIELSDRKPAVLSDYAWFMATERGPKLGKEAAEAAVEADAGSSTAWAALGLAQYRLHRRVEAEASLRRALELNPNDIYAQSAMVTLLQDRRQDSRAEALVGLLEEHAGTEDLVAAVRDEAKRRRIGRMLVERKVDVDAPPREPRSAVWIWVLAAATLVGILLSFFGPMYLPIVLGLTVVLLLVLYSLLGALFAAAFRNRLSRLRLTLAGILFGLCWYFLSFRLIWSSVAPLITSLHIVRTTMWGHAIYGALLARYPVYTAMEPGPARGETAGDEPRPE